jgi:hypothetical protein
MPLPFASIAVAHAIADSHRFGFEIVDATGSNPARSIPCWRSWRRRTRHVDLGRRDPRQAGQTPAPPLLRPHCRRRDGAGRGARTLPEPEAGVVGGLEDPTGTRMTARSRPPGWLRVLLRVALMVVPLVHKPVMRLDPHTGSAPTLPGYH